VGIAAHTSTIPAQIDVCSPQFKIQIYRKVGMEECGGEFIVIEGRVVELMLVLESLILAQMRSSYFFKARDRVLNET
jgi:Na+/proline symporter